MAFAVDAFGLGGLVDLAPAPELQVGFSVGYVCWLGMLRFDVMRLCGLGRAVFLLCVLAFGSRFGVLPGVCALMFGSRF
jgi:hypothetical protein